MQVWRSYGKLRMEELFAKMGFSLAQCKVPLPTAMPQQHKSALTVEATAAMPSDPPPPLNPLMPVPVAAILLVVLLLQEKYKYMDPGLRQRLRAELERHQPDYSLDDVRDPHRPTHPPTDSYMPRTAVVGRAQIGRQAASNHAPRLSSTSLTCRYDVPVACFLGVCRCSSCRSCATTATAARSAPPTSSTGDQHVLTTGPRSHQPCMPGDGWPDMRFYV